MNTESDRISPKVCDRSHFYPNTMITNIAIERFVYDEAHYQSVAIEMLYQDNVQQLLERLSYQELLNHISTVFWCDAAVNRSEKLTGFDIEIQVGKCSPSLQSLMRRSGIKGIVGLTPKFPIQNSSATDEENQAYVYSLQAHLELWNIDYVKAKGRARDFRDGGDGCFLLIDVSLEEVQNLLEQHGEPTQLSITYLPPVGVAQLISCIEPKPEENNLKALLLKMSQRERAIALSFLGAVLADIDYPSANSPLVFEFMLYAQRVGRDRQIKLANLLTQLLAKPTLLNSR
jgi:hypothetical protein